MSLLFSAISLHSNVAFASTFNNFQKMMFSRIKVSMIYGWIINVYTIIDEKICKRLSFEVSKGIIM